MIRKVTIWLMIVCVMGLVFYFSNETVSSSMKVSIDISDKVLMLVNHFSAYLQMDGDYLFHLIRKFTHFIFYITLGGLVFKACIQNRQSTVYNIGFTMPICIVFAIFNKVHQLFIPGKSEELRDLMIDGIGALGGIGKWMKEVLEGYSVRGVSTRHKWVWVYYVCFTTKDVSCNL